MSNRRRRGGGGTQLTETEIAAPAPTAAAAADDNSDAGSAAGSGASDPPAIDSRRTTGRRLGGSGNGRFARRASQHHHDHQPSFWAQCAASVRSSFSFCFGNQDRYFLSRYQIAANMPLQMTLYFSLPWGLVYAALSQYLYVWKSQIYEVPLVVAVVSPMIFTVWALLEPIRLVLGYVGNLRERVAWLGGFWVLTVFPQLVVHIYFLVGQSAIGWINLPIETAMSIINILVVLTQLAFGYTTIRRLIAKAMADFHLQPVDVADDPALTL